MFNELLNALFKTTAGNLDSSNGATSESSRWCREAVTIQQTLHSNFHGRKWSFYKGTDHVYLKRNIGFALFGPPDELPSESNGKTGFSTEKLKTIENVFNTVRENDNHEKMRQQSISIKAFSMSVHHPSTQPKPLKFSQFCIDSNEKFKRHELSLDKPESREIDTIISVIFVVLQSVSEDEEGHAYPEPVFRVPSDSDGIDRCRFIDRNSRVYKGWDEFLEHNHLPPGRICYPVGGVYSGDARNQVQVAFGETPATIRSDRYKLTTVEPFQSQEDSQEECPDQSEIKKSVDLQSIIGDSAKEVSSKRTLIWSSQLILFFANAIMMIDAVNVKRGEKSTEDAFFVEILAPKDQDSFKEDSWQSIDENNNLGMVAMGANFNTNRLKISPKTTNCYGVVNAAHFLHEKHKNKTELTREEVAQFSACVLFFTMSEIGEKAARKVINEADEEMVNSLRTPTGKCGAKMDTGERSGGLVASMNSTSSGRPSVAAMILREDRSY